MREDVGISIIIPCYNDGRYLRDAVDSIYAQNIKNFPFQIVIVDDASKEQKTREHIHQLEQEYPAIKAIYRKNNGGTAAARNTALEHSDYPYILALDADDKLSSDPKLLKGGGYLERAVTLLEQDHDVVFTFCGFKRFEGASNASPRPIYNEKKLLGMHGIGPHIVFSRDEALRIGGYNTAISYAEDWDFNVSLLNGRYEFNKENGQHKRPVKVHQFYEPYILYRIRADGSSKTDKNSIPREEELKKIISRNPGIYERHYKTDSGQPLFGQQLVDAVMNDAKKDRFSYKKEFLKKCLVKPYGAYKDGSFAFLRSVLNRKLKNKRGRLIAQFRGKPKFQHDQATVEPQQY